MVTKSSRPQNTVAKDARQDELFATPNKSRAADELLVLHALGEFQQRGKVLADRSLPLDRLRGALRRQSALSGIEELGDERFAEILSALGARVLRVPSFVAKHPFRVTVPQSLAERALREVAGREADSPA